MEMKVFLIYLIFHFFKFTINFDVTINVNNENFFVFNSSNLNDAFNYNINKENKCDCSVNYMYNLQKEENDTFFNINLSDNENFNKDNLTINCDNKDLINIEYDINQINSNYYTLSIIQKCEKDKILKKNWGIISIEYNNKTLFSYLKYCNLNNYNKILSKLGLYFSFFLIFINAIYYEYIITKTEIKVINSYSNIDDGEIKINSIFSVILLGSLTLLILYYLRGKLFLNIYTFLIIQQIFISITIKLEELYENSEFFKNKKYSFLSNNFISKFNFKIYQLIINIISLILTLIYLISKHWILNNIIVGFLSYSIISIYHIKNFRICILFLFITLIYDIFWVYFSPFFFNGENIMVYVASKINLPIKLQIPKLFTEKHPLNNCIVLGLGDIAIPGFTIKFLKRFDFLKKTNVYYNLGIIMFSLALFTSALINFIFNYPQPVLLYMFPFLCFSVLILAFKRNEIYDILFSEKVEKDFLRCYKENQEKIRLKNYQFNYHNKIDNFSYNIKNNISLDENDFEESEEFEEDEEEEDN